MFSSILSLYLMSAQPQKSNDALGVIFMSTIALTAGVWGYGKMRGKTEAKEKSKDSNCQVNPCSFPQSKISEEWGVSDIPSVPEDSATLFEVEETKNPDCKFPSDIQELLGRIAREDGSTALCGDPGTGKSTITREYIRQVRESHPQAKIKVLAVKNDSFCGLREEGFMTRFDDEEVDVGIAFFREVKKEYKRRLGLPESERSNLPPYVVILDDWISISKSLLRHQSSQSKRKPSEDECINEEINFGSVLYNILTIGREYNMKFFVNLHSINLKAIGIEDMDANSRSMLKILILGNRYSKGGRDLDAYGIIDRAITGSQVIADLKLKEDIKKQYYLLKKESRKLMQPMAFAFIGEYYVGLVPRFAPETKVKEKTLEPLQDIALNPEIKVEPTEPQEVPDNVEPLEPTLEEQFGVIRRKKEGLAKKEIILQVWGATKGGGKKYKIAEAKYESIVKQLN